MLSAGTNAEPGEATSQVLIVISQIAFQKEHETKSFTTQARAGFAGWFPEVSADFFRSWRSHASGRKMSAACQGPGPVLFSCSCAEPYEPKPTRTSATFIDSQQVCQDAHGKRHVLLVHVHEGWPMPRWPLARIYLDCKVSGVWVSIIFASSNVGSLLALLGFQAAPNLFVACASKCSYCQALPQSKKQLVPAIVATALLAAHSLAADRGMRGMPRALGSSAVRRWSEALFIVVLPLPALAPCRKPWSLWDVV